MSVKQENRYRKLVISQGRVATDRKREIEAATMERSPRKPAIPPPPSARRHQCRGHWRNLQSGKRVWVKDCWKGDASNGTVFKDYKT